MQISFRRKTDLSYPFGIGLILCLLITSAHTALRYRNGHFFDDNGIPVYFHGAGTSSILLDPGISIKDHNTWFDSLGANANRIKGFHRTDKNFLSPWIKIKPWKATHKMFDLLRMDPAYLSRLTEYALDMQSRNNYILFQFFEGELLSKENWPHHPFNSINNINEITMQENPSKGFYDITNRGLVRFQKYYVEQIIKTLAPFGNVIFELTTNYQGDTQWQHLMSYFLYKLGEKYNTVVLVINDIPEEMIEQSIEDLDGFDIHSISHSLTPEAFSALTTQLWKYNKPVFNSYALLGQGGKFKNKSKKERMILTLWLHRVHGIQFSGAGPVEKSHWKDHTSVIEPFKFFHENVNKMSFWSMKPHNEMVDRGWCLAHPGYEYLTLVIDQPEVTIDFSNVNQHLNYVMYDPLTLKQDWTTVREHTPVQGLTKYKNKVGSGSMVIMNADGIARNNCIDHTNDIHLAWQANRTIYHKMKRGGKWHATEVISNPEALFSKHVQMDIDDERNIYVSFGGPPPWKKGSELLNYRSQWRKFDSRAWGPVELLNDGPWPAGNFADLVVDHHGRIHYIYSERNRPGEKFKAEARAVIVEPDGKRTDPILLYREGSKDLHFQVVVDSKNRIYAMNGWRYKCRIKVWYSGKWGPEKDFPGLYPRQNFWGWHARVGKHDLVYVVGSSGGRKPPEGPDLNSDVLHGEPNFTRPLLLWILKPTQDPYQPEILGPIYFGYGSYAKMCINPITGFPVVIYTRRGNVFYREWNGINFESENEIPTPGIHAVGFDDDLMPRAGSAITIDHNNNWHAAFAGVEKLYYIMRRHGQKKWSDIETIHEERGLCRIEILTVPPENLAKRRW